MVQPYQEYCGGSHDVNLSGKLVYSGSLRVQVPEVSYSIYIRKIPAYLKYKHCILKSILQK